MVSLVHTPDDPTENMRPEQRNCSPEERAVWDALADVPDPEVPALSLLDLGVIRRVHILKERTKGAVKAGGEARIEVTPTYT
ncbi:MAG: DUF59 domain-containing protein, partial [Kordiimonadaceae bacterium]|nr:DUF59 domain-containing protein [Kordiimonadaceae bacterium]